MDIDVHEIEHVLVQSTKEAGRYALNQAEGVTLFTRARIEFFYDNFWHEGRVVHMDELGGYVFRADEDGRIFALKAGMHIRIPMQDHPF